MLRREFEPAPPRQQETVTGEINEIEATLFIPRNSIIDKDEQVNLATSFSGPCEMPEGVESVSQIITSKGGEINLKDEIGATLSIPRNSTAKDERVNFSTGFSGLCEMPEGVESASPAYLIKTTNEVEFKKPVDVTLQHTSNLQTAEDCKEMMILEASCITHEDSDSILSFEKIDNSSGAVSFSPGERHGRLRLKKLFSWFKIGRKQNGNKSRDQNNYCFVIN